MRIIHRTTVSHGADHIEVTLAIRPPRLRPHDTRYHVYQRSNGALAFHRSYTRADTVSWPGAYRPGRYSCPDPAEAAMQDYDLTVNALYVDGYTNSVMVEPHPDRRSQAGLPPHRQRPQAPTTSRAQSARHHTR